MLLSEPKLAEVPELFGFLGNQDAMRHTSCDANLAECRRRIVVHEWRRRKDGFAPWSIRQKSNARVIGWGGLYEDPFDPGWGIELAYYFHPSVWGNGYATELCLTALRIADDQLKAPKLSAFAHPDNMGSHRLLGKLGFLNVRYIADIDRNLYCRNRPSKLIKVK